MLQSREPLHLTAKVFNMFITLSENLERVRGRKSRGYLREGLWNHGKN